ncbi:Transcription factor [Aspergillus sclerotialis]|uniref:Transcription factor n=1 Tax=Aspergillus sclerotialis TaxID=2070753 RepID=A0A3A2ZIV8_9EURO|nr:Transcription factor [Aspergillus sclerotialis]
MPPASSAPNSYRTEEMAYPSRTIAFQAAGMITSIIENLQAHDEIKYTPAFIVYSLFSALIMHVYQMRSSVPSVVATCQERIAICMQALKDVSKVWLVAKMVHTLFESILGNKVLEERLQKAAGKRHQKMRPEAQQPKRLIPRSVNSMKWILACQMEGRRHRFPATPSREMGQTPAMGTQTSPNPPRETLPGMGASRGNTRPTTPFNAQFSLPATPPDLFLVTRTSPNLSPSLWENFQPDQLFPDGTAIFPELSSPQNNAVDPQLQMQSHLQTQNMQRPMMMNQQQQMPSRNVATQGSPQLLSSVPPGMTMQGSQPQMFGMENQQPWPMGLDPPLSGAPLDNASQDDNWSSSSRSGPTAPTTLNVEDWFQFFGINGSFGEMTT